MKMIIDKDEFIFKYDPKTDERNVFIQSKNILIDGVSQKITVSKMYNYGLKFNRLLDLKYIKL